MEDYKTHQYETSMKHETRTVAGTPSLASRSILSFSPAYNGIGADEYIEWKSKIDNIFA